MFVGLVKVTKAGERGITEELIWFKPVKERERGGSMSGSALPQRSPHSTNEGNSTIHQHKAEAEEEDQQDIRHTTTRTTSTSERYTH